MPRDRTVLAVALRRASELRPSFRQPSRDRSLEPPRSSWSLPSMQLPASSSTLPSRQRTRLDGVERASDGLGAIGRAYTASATSARVAAAPAGSPGAATAAHAATASIVGAATAASISLAGRARGHRVVHDERVTVAVSASRAAGAADVPRPRGSAGAALLSAATAADRDEAREGGVAATTLRRTDRFAVGAGTARADHDRETGSTLIATRTVPIAAQIASAPWRRRSRGAPRRPARARTSS